MFYLHKAYLNARGGPSVLNLSHDVKRCLSDSQAKSGVIQILSTQGTTGVILMENDAELQKESLSYFQKQFEASSGNKVARKSRTGANCFHHMAALVGLSLTISFDGGRLLASPFHEILAFDFEPSPGRREFIITVIGE